MSRSRLQSLNSNIDHMKCSLSSKNSPKNTVDFEAACSVYIRIRGVNGYWQIELFFKELKSTLGLHHYRFKEFEKAETWVKLCLVTFVYLEWIRARKLKQKSLKKKEREWWQVQRTYGLAL